jgi:hypothetical protein
MKGNHNQKEIAMATATIEVCNANASNIDSREDVGLREKLEQLGLEYDVVRVNMLSVDTDRNEYQTRQHSIVDRETVERYKMSLNSGECVFPEMLFAATLGSRKTGAKSLVPVCGRHRIVAHKEAGIASTLGIVVYVKNETDKAKLVTVSRWDNFRNGAPETVNAHYQGLAQECIALAGGVMNGFPPKSVIDEIASRNSIAGQYKTRLKMHIRAMLFQAECRSLRIPRVPENAALCAAAYDFVDREGFEAIAKTVCANQSHKGIAGVVKECSQRRLSGKSAVDFIKDTSSGFSECPVRMTSADEVRLRLNALTDSLKKLDQDPSVTTHCVELLEKHLEEAFERAAQVTARIKERHTNE